MYKVVLSVQFCPTSCNEFCPTSCNEFCPTSCSELHPRVIQRFMPKIVADIPNLNTHSHSIVTLKVCACTLPLVPVLCNHSTYTSRPFFLLILQLLSSHYEYFARYYGSGMLDRTFLGLASEEEKTCSALVVYRLLDTLSEKVQCDIQVTLLPTMTLTLTHMNTISEEFSLAISLPTSSPPIIPCCVPAHRAFGQCPLRWDQTALFPAASSWPPCTRAAPPPTSPAPWTSHVLCSPPS